MKLSSKVNLYFISLIVLNSIFFSTQVLDRTLVPRFIFLSALMLISSFVFVKDWSTSKFKAVYLVDFLLITYYVIACLSTFYAANIGEAFFENQKLSLVFLSYYLTRFLLLQTGEKAEKMLCQSVAIVTVCSIIYLVWEYVNLRSGFEFKQFAHINLKGLSSHKNLSTAFLLLCLPLNIIGLLQKNNQLWKWLFRIAILLSVIVILILQTRSVYVALAISSIFLLIALGLTSKLFKQINTKKIIISVSITIVSTFLFVYFLGNISFFGTKANVLNYGQSRSAQERLFIWNKTSSLIQDHWVTGVGSGNWKLIFPSYGIGGWDRTEERGVIFQRPHNDFLWVFSELGIMGILVYGAILLLIFWAGIHTAIANKGSTLSIKLWIVLAGLLAYYIFSCFSFPRERLELLVFWTLLLALISYYSHDFFKNKYSLKISNKLKNNYLLIFFGTLLGFNLVVGYHRFQGEKNMQQAYAYNTVKNWNKLKQSVKAAYSPVFYTLDYTSMPLKWFEGTVYHKSKQFDKALTCQLKALEHNPYNDRVLNDVAAIYGEKKNLEKAEKYLLKALAVNPSRQTTHLNLAFLYYYMKKYDKIGLHLDRVKDEKHQQNKNRLLASLQSLGY